MGGKFFALYRSLLNVHYGWSANKYYYFKKRRRIWEPLLLAFFLIPFLLTVMIAAWRLAEDLYLGGLAFGQPHLALVYTSLLVSLLGLFYGFFYVISAFYFSTDLPVLLPLPLTAGEILGAKLGVVLTGQYVANALVLIPVWLKYGLLAKTGISFLLSAALVFFSLPIIPLVIASLLSVLLMRFVNLSRHKDKLSLIGGFLLFVVVIGFQVWLRTHPEGDPEALLTIMLGQGDGLVRLIGRYFPPALWASRAMGYSHLGRGWLNMAYLLGASAAALGVLYLTAKRVFIQSLLAGQEVDRGKRKRVSLAARAVRPAVWALALNEIKLFIRNPGYALNGLIGYLLFPFLAVLPLFTKNMPQNPLDFLAGQQFPPQIIVAITALFFFLMTAFSSIPATTFSREGRKLWVVKSLPLSIHRLMAGKVLGAQMINFLGCFIGLLPLAFVFRWPPAAVLGGIACGIPLAAASSYLLALLDLWRPMLDWVNPIKAVKSNLNVLIGTFAAVFLVIGLGIRFYFNFVGGRLWLIPLELLLLTAVLMTAAGFLAKAFAAELWRQIEGGS